MASDQEPTSINRRPGTLVPPPGADDAETLNGLSVRQTRAVAALLAEPTIQKAAQSIDIPDRTLYRWLQEPIFAAAYRAARRNAFQQAIGLSHKYAPLAVQTLAKVMADPKAPAGAKVSAAKGLLEFSRESIEVDDLAARVDALEARARQIDDTNLVDATSFEVKDIDVPPEALPGGEWVTEDGVQPDFKADAESFRTRPEKKP